MPSSIASWAVDSPQRTETMVFSPAFSTISTSDSGITSLAGRTPGFHPRVTPNRVQMLLSLLEEVDQSRVDQGVGGVRRNAREIAQVVVGERIAGRAGQRQHAETFLAREQGDRDK